MHTFRVWAPQREKVELQLGAKVYPMSRGGEGWWTVEIPSAKPGDDYGFIVDGEGPFPDPRSRYQPSGVHGLSRLIDPNGFQWTDQSFQAPPLPAALVYELHIGTFTPGGTFSSAIEKLDHLVSLGVTHVELMPVAEFGGSRGWGYDGVDLFAPHHAYGSPDDLKKLVNACHGRGLAVILDVVYNHLGPSGNYLGKFGPYFTKKFSTFWGDGINYDGAESHEVRRFFCDNALMWLEEFHFDGLRLDAVHGIFDTSAVHVLEQLKLEVEELSERVGRHLILIPESDLNDPRLLWSRERGGYQLDAQWSDDFHHALHTVLTGEDTGYYSDFGKLEHLAKALQSAFVYNGTYSAHRQRAHGRPADGLNGHRFLGYLQNHDQIGNRAQGDRSTRLMSQGRLKIGAALVLTSPFIPMLFQGEEWGASTPFLFFTDHQEPELANAIREGRCKEFSAFGWKPEDTPDPQAHETFLKSTLNWKELLQPSHAALLDWHKALVQLRRKEAALASGDLKSVRIQFDETRRWFIVERGSIVVVCNLAAKQKVPLPSATKCEVLLASESGVEFSADGIVMPEDSVVIVRSKG